METKIEELEDIFQKLRSLTKRVAGDKSTGQINAQPADNERVCPAELQGSIKLESTENNAKENTRALNGASEKELCDALHRNGELEVEVEMLRRKVKSLESQILEIDTERSELLEKNKEYREELIKARGTIRVVCRIKPGVLQSTCRYNDRCISIDGKKFSVDHIFSPESTQREVFSEFKPSIESVLNGYNVCILAYGQTGSGKTYTMIGSDGNRGLIYNMIEYLSRIESEYKMQGYEFLYKLRYVEIYNESVYDLATGEVVQLVHDSEGVHLRGCKEIEFSGVSDSEDLVHKFNLKRRVGETRCNQESSRSHLLLMLGVSMRGKDVRGGTICLIDLAGSERLNESKAENERLKETQNINKSLSSLGDVISALKRGDRHVPFRNSKLTHLLQEYLGTRSQVTMIVNVNAENVGETVCSLRFASKVSECHLGASERNVQRTLAP